MSQIMSHAKAADTLAGASIVSLITNTTLALSDVLDLITFLVAISAGIVSLILNLKKLKSFGKKDDDVQ